MGGTVLLALALFAVAPARAADTTLAGQLVCSACWYEAERPRVPYGDDADFACAKRCAADGIPRALAVRSADGTFELILLDARALPGGDAATLDLVGARVEATGELRDSEPARTLEVEALRVLEPRQDVPGRAAAAPTTVPRFVLPDLLGTDQSLDALRGRIVVLNFWATWCAPCRDEMPALVRIQNRYGAWGVQVIGASADGPEARDAVVAFVRKAKVGFPIWLGATIDRMSSFGLTPVLPGTVVIDRHGRIALASSGVVTEAQLAAVIDRLIAESAPQEVAFARTTEPVTASRVPP